MAALELARLGALILLGGLRHQSCRLLACAASVAAAAVFAAATAAVATVAVVLAFGVSCVAEQLVLVSFYSSFGDSAMWNFLLCRFFRCSFSPCVCAFFTPHRFFLLSWLALCWGLLFSFYYCELRGAGLLASFGS